MKRLLILFAAITALASCNQSSEVSINVIPYPNDVVIKSGTFVLKDNNSIHYDDGLDEASRNVVFSFAEQLSHSSGIKFLPSEGKGRKGFIFMLDPELDKEAYRLTVSRKAVVAEASDLNGFIYAIQTIKQMLPSDIYKKGEAGKAVWTLPCCKIEDAPRFGYRGLHLDVSRHFFDTDAVKRYIDIMEVHKLNTFHWHLTDDQGWRIEIKKYPKLTEVGSIRKETLSGHFRESDTYDNTPYGKDMWYSQDEIREIIAYAASKGITVIPEIDIPGHMVAALASYPELGCTGGPYDVRCTWGIANEVLCAGKESTMKFIENVLSEVCELFPSKYIHIGGDECPKLSWEKCKHCQAKIKELGLKDDDKYMAEHYLQSYVTARIEKFLASKGRKLIGWDEILEGELAPDATVMSWRGISGGLQAVRMGHDAIMTPNTYFYLDYYQTSDTDNEPLAIGGYLPVEKCYSYEPTSDDMTEEEVAHILGVQANMWTEYIGTEKYLQYMLLPRLAALSEVQWCNKDRKCLTRFFDSIDEICKIYEKMGYKYATHVFDVKGDVKVNHDEGCVEVTFMAQGDAPVRYTLDGSIPDANSSLYEGPIRIENTCTLKAKADRPDGKGDLIFSKSFVGHKAMGRPVTGNGKPREKYSFNYPDNLTDGVRGIFNHSSGEWIGMHGKPLDVIIEMDGSKYNSVTLSTLISKSAHIFNPLGITVSVSKNDMDYQKVANIDIPIEGQDDPDGIKEYVVTFPETDSRYIHIKAESVASLPDWHSGKGGKGYLFVDEIIVK